MDDHVEARSLASLNYLAANPPQYPKKPNEERQDPIILYISRVPGTRDIILSTLKPQVKSVTAEDVASSLYYVHLNGPEDEVIIPPPGQTKPPSPRTSGESSRSAIQRKPVPGTSNLASSRANENIPPPSIKENQGNNGQTKPPMRNPSLRKPVPQSVPAPLSQRPPASQFVSPPPPPPRKPVGPRQIASDSPERNPPLSPIYDQPPEYQVRPSMDVPSLPPRPSELEDPFLGYGRSPSPKSPTKQRPFTPFSLTLIRRDPSSGQQWNVGKVASFQLENPELINDEKHRHPSPSIMIHLETSGYAKFRGMPTQTTQADLREIRASLDMRPGSASSSMKFPQIPDLNPPITASNAFERQVVMAYSKSFGAAIREKFHHRSASDEDRSPPPVFPPRKARHGSMGSIGSFGGDFDGGEAPVITQPAPGLKPRGYMFKSPWGGRCEFVTGNAGRSLKCRHVLPNYTGTIFNPLVDGQEARHHGHKPKGQPISELRFNLPSSELFAEKRSTEGGARTRDQLQSQFNRVLQKAHGIDHHYDDDDEEDGWHLDLSLGREKAGGGNRGKRAKMGKLIVFDDGLKMLDLVVAANVGVWWTAWERTDLDRDLAHDIRRCCCKYFHAHAHRRSDGQGKGERGSGRKEARTMKIE